MLDVLLALVPTYGVWFIAVSVFLSCLALPIPSSMFVMVAGGFAAAEDLVFWQIVLAAYAGYTIGDQLAFGIGRRAGLPLVGWLSSREAFRSTVSRAHHLIDRHGTFAVFLSRTLFSPLGPYIGYLGGAMGMRWHVFTLTANPAALVWALAYASLGFVFASRIREIASLLSSALGAVLFGASSVVLLWWLWQRWRSSDHSE